MKRSSATWLCGLTLVAILVGCTRQVNPPDFTRQVSSGDSKQPSKKAAALGRDDFCIDGVALGASVEELRALKKVNIRHLGGYDYTFPWSDAYMSEDGASVDILQSNVKALCANDQRLNLEAVTDVTPNQVLEAYGEPSKKVTEGDEYWFYMDPGKTGVLIFQFRPANGMTAVKVQVARILTTERQWYPLLGESIIPRPLTRKDASVGPIVVGSDPDLIGQALGESGSEGEKRPYWKLSFRDEQIQVYHDNAVRAIIVRRDTSLATPRGIRIGNSSDAVRDAYGRARVAPDGQEGEYWSYESLRQGVGLVFSIQGGRVVQIMVMDTGYEYRPRVAK